MLTKKKDFTTQKKNQKVWKRETIWFFIKIFLSCIEIEKFRLELSFQLSLAMWAGKYIKGNEQKEEYIRKRALKAGYVTFNLFD